MTKGRLLHGFVQLCKKIMKNSLCRPEALSERRESSVAKQEKYAAFVQQMTHKRRFQSEKDVPKGGAGMGQI